MFPLGTFPIEGLVGCPASRLVGFSPTDDQLVYWFIVFFGKDYFYYSASVRFYLAARLAICSRPSFISSSLRFLSILAIFEDRYEITQSLSSQNSFVFNFLVRKSQILSAKVGFLCSFIGHEIQLYTLIYKLLSVFFFCLILDYLPCNGLKVFKGLE